MVELFEDVGAGGKAEDDPGDGRRGGVLASHEKGNHHVGYLDVWDGHAVFVGARHEVPDHVVRVFLYAGLPAGADDFHIGLGHFLLRVVTFSIVREGRPR